MASDMLLPIILSELVDSDDEKPRRSKTREWIRRRSQLGLYETLIKELIIEDRLSFKEMFRMSVGDFVAVLSQIHDLIAPQEFQGGPRPISSDERLALAIRYMATGESFHSLSFQFRISRKAVSYIVKGCCDAWTGLPRIIRSKCWMKEWVNQSNTKIALEESEKVGRKV